jgi:hypothetical protein
MASTAALFHPCLLKLLKALSNGGRLCGGWRGFVFRTVGLGGLALPVGFGAKPQVNGRRRRLPSWVGGAGFLPYWAKKGRNTTPVFHVFSWFFFDA